MSTGTTTCSARALASNSLTADQIEVRAYRYQFPVARGLWLWAPEVTKMQTPPEADYLRRELRRLAEAVLVAMDRDVDLAAADREDFPKSVIQHSVPERTPPWAACLSVFVSRARTG